MTVATGVLLAAVLVLLYQRERDARTMEKLLAAASVERRSLLDRIQHAHIYQVPVEDFEPAVPPKDGAELAMVGMEVPEFIQVGQNGSEES